MSPGRDFDDELEALGPAEEAALSRALVSAVRPQELSEERHEALLEAALADPTAEPSDEERAAADDLRRALEAGAQHPDAELARALARAVREASELEALRASQKAAVRVLTRTRSITLAAAAAGALALAAAAALLLSPPPEVEYGRQPEFAESRSLSPLFVHETGASSSERLDRIVAVRSRELRDNRFAAWGVR